MVMVLKLNLRLMCLQVEDLLVNFILESVGFTAFNLTSLQHLLNEVILMDEKVVLRSPMLNSLLDLWELLFNVVLHVVFRPFDIVL